MKTKASRRILSILLTVLMILPVMAVIGCNKRYLDIDDAAAVADNVDNTPEVVDDEPAETKAETEAAAKAEAKIETEADEPDDLDDAKAEGAGGEETTAAAAEPVTEDTIAFSDLSDYTIVYGDSLYAKICAERIRDAIKARTDVSLTLTTEATAETDKEILVGKTNRDESEALRETYARPNICFDIKVSGSKLVVMAEGYTTLEYVAEKFEEYMSDANNTAFSGSVYDCDISPAIDALGTSMLNYTEGTDLRVFHWNLAATIMHPNEAYTKISDIPSNAHRAEVISDVMLQMMPDIITINEMYDGHYSGLYEIVVKELSDYYDILDVAYYNGRNPENPTDTGYIKDEPFEGADAIVGAYSEGEVSIPQTIFHKKSLELEVVDAGWHYLDITDDARKSENNPYGIAYWYAYHTAIFQNKSGKQFIVSVGHYGNSTDNTKFAEAHLAAITAIKDRAGITEDIPTIVTGDMYTGVNTTESWGAGYRYWEGQGFSDCQVDAIVNANSPEGCIRNDNRLHGTSHRPGVREITRISQDFIWINEMDNSGLTALCFKVLVSMEIDGCSDHYPVMADIKFN